MNNENLQKVVDEYIKSSNEASLVSNWKNVFTGKYTTFSSVVTKTPVEKLLI
jgi:hypothetical protein